VVSVATSGASAIESIRGMRRQSKLFDAIVIDSFMPDLDGYHIVQETGQAPARFVIMLPSANPKVETQRLAPLGIGAYVVKPVKRHELLAAVAAVVGQCAAAAPVSVEYQNRKHTATLPGEPMRILFADDSPDNRALIKAYMKSTPHSIDFAEDGKEAINKFMTNHYDLVFMDIQMPVVDGYTAVQEIRRWEDHMSRSPTPVVALTASADMEAVRRTKEAGCNLHVSKPLKKATLLETIKSCAHEPAAAALSSPPSKVA